MSFGLRIESLCAAWTVTSIAAHPYKPTASSLYPYSSAPSPKLRMSTILLLPITCASQSELAPFSWLAPSVSHLVGVVSSCSAPQVDPPRGDPVLALPNCFSTAAVSPGLDLAGDAAPAPKRVRAQRLSNFLSRVGGLELAMALRERIRGSMAPGRSASRPVPALTPGRDGNGRGLLRHAISGGLSASGSPARSPVAGGSSRRLPRTVCAAPPASSSTLHPPTAGTGSPPAWPASPFSGLANSWP